MITYYYCINNVNSTQVLCGRVEGRLVLKDPAPGPDKETVRVTRFADPVTSI